ncbi:MAG: helix-turn-helix domain-containing protein [Candidatus Methanomethylophilaceae archaeon]|nr:helix-turn-helix domain-containing protein [Candidatus Methanomethylophilaceae archaeon]
MAVNRDFVASFVRGVFRPGAVLVSYGMRGGGKTHCAVSFCQRLVEGYYPDTPKHVEVITNVIFVRKADDGGFRTEAPPHVHMVHGMREVFPVIVDALERHGRKDTLIILLLDEAQNFLLGDDNSRTEMASSMKKFCGIIRKFNLCLWLISPAMRNLGPAFRNFLDADTDPGNVNATLQKDTAKARRFISSKKMEMDPRSIVFVRTGAKERVTPIPVPTSPWTRDPDTISPGEYVYDNLSSADFEIGDFPFREFVQHISGRSSYELVGAVRSFYRGLGGSGDPGDSGKTAEEAVRDREAEIFRACLAVGLTQAQIAKILGKHPNTIAKWVKRLGGGRQSPSEDV